MRRLTTCLLLAAGLLAGAVATGAQAQQPRNMQSSAGQPSGGQPQADVSKSGGARAENCGTPDEPRPCPPLPRNNLTEFPRNR